MKRLLILLFLLLPATSWGIMGPIVGGGGNSCSVSTNAVGDKTDYSPESSGISADQYVCHFYQAPTCSGTFSTAYFYHSGTDSQTAKVCVFSAQHGTDHAPDSGDTKVGCSEGTTVSTQAWQTLSGTVGGAITPGGYYYVCLASSGSLLLMRTASGTGNGYVASLNYATPPANMNGTWSTTANRSYSLYVTVAHNEKMEYAHYVLHVTLPVRGTCH